MATQTENFPITPTHAEKCFSTPAKNQYHPGLISKVRVVLKLRPFLPLEISSRNGNSNSCVSIQDSDSSVDDVTVLLKDRESSRKECFKLDAVFGQEDDNVSQIFEKELRSLIPGLFQGYNATVFAYGATGSGKTYTMQGTDHLPGLIPLSISNILSMCEFTGSSITISYYEIYLDKCYDLLVPNEKEILVWNNKNGQIHLKGLAQIEVSSLAEFNGIFSSALQRRKVAQTGLNDLSSRSHGILAVTILTPSRSSSVGNAVTGKLNLIDLAGNEDNRRTCNEGLRLQESTKINQSLFALSNVIYALNNGESRIPYRESKLTRILQDSLGGTSRALMVSCLNPGEYQESVHTVRLAARSRHVTNFVGPAQSNGKSNAKVDMDAKLASWLESKGKTKSSQSMGLCRSRVGRTPSSIKPLRKLNTSVHSNKTKAVRDQLSPCQGLSYADHNREAENLFVAEINEEIYGDASESNPDLSYESLFEEKQATITKSINSISLSPVNENTKVLRSPFRKILSPIDSNSEKSNFSPSEPMTPKKNPILGDGENNIQVLGTPLDKLTARSLSLKSTLVQDFIDFLNTASSEELMKLKGIGCKIAEKIVEQRETSPLKSLGDLEKIGLSSKQVHNMFGKAASGLLEKLAYNNV